MKRRSLVVASSLGVLGLAITPLACFSSSSASPQPEDTDSGATSPGDSGQSVDDATTASHDGGTVDTGVADTGADATVADASPGPLTLTVLQGGAPEPGVTIVFQDDTGAVVTTATTDATGTVTQFVMAGSQVTALLGSTQSPDLVTIQAVAPGDALTVLDATPSTSPAPGEDVTVTLPAATWDASGITEAVYAGSCYNPILYPLYLSSSCESAGLFPLLARAFDGTTGEEVAYTYQLGNVVDPEGGLPDGDTALPITVTRPWATSTATATLTATNPPGLPYDGGATSTATDVSLTYSESAGGVSIDVPASPGGATDDAGTQVADFVMHPGFPDFVEGQGLDRVETNGRVVVAAGATRVSPLATSTTMSFDLSTLPLITASSIDTTDVGTTERPDVTWTSAGSLSGADGIFVSAQWNSSATTDAGTVYTNGTWTILAPPTATNVRAPALPATLAAWAPQAAATFDSLPRVGAMKASYLGGYAGLRTVFGVRTFLSGYEIVPPTLPVNGTVYLVGFYPDEG